MFQSKNIFLLVALIFGLVGFTKNHEITIQDVHLTCANEAQCPDNQGLFLAIYRPKEDGPSVERCSGTLYDSDKVILAGHCLQNLDSASEIWFMTASKNGKPGHRSRVSPKPLAAEVSMTDKMLPDYGAVQLLTPIHGITFAHSAANAPSDLRDVLALVVNKRPKAKSVLDFVLESVACTQARSELNSLAYAENPVKFSLFDCNIAGGNSGGAIVRRDDPNAILGVINSGPRQELAEFSDDKSTMATNTRCFAMPEWPQTEANCTLQSIKSAVALAHKLDAQAFATKLEMEVRAWASAPQTTAWVASTGLDFDIETADLKILRPSDSPGLAHEGVALVPIPICVRSLIPAGQTRQLTIVPWTYLSEGKDGRIPKDTIRFNSDLSINASIHAEEVQSGGHAVRYRLFIEATEGRTKMTVWPKSFILIQAKIENSITLPQCPGVDGVVPTK